MEFDKTNIITTHNRLVRSSSLRGATIQIKHFAYPSLNVAFYSVPRYKISTVRIREYSHGNFS